MFKKWVLFGLSGILALSLLLGGCSKSEDSEISQAPPRGVTGEIETGKKVKAASEKISSDGGSIVVDKEDSPINGLEITVQSGSYDENKEFEISYSPVETHTFGEDFNPVTPLISIDNGGEFSENIMEVTIPVEIPDDYFAMGFIYDDETKTLEGMPLIARDENSITVGTRHFTDMLISMIPYAELKKDIDTGFRPGIDDWQFVNYGSYIAPGGHCAGQCLTALWYYVNQPDGQDLTLYGRYDNNGDDPATPGLWNDDSDGYRFASTIQHDINWSSFANNFWGHLAGTDDQTNYYLFAYSMQVTGEPQEVGIFSNAGGGHDMICYRIYQGNLYIADPNYPGNTDRRIEFVDGNFKPYNSGANAAEIAAGRGQAYEKIGYCAKTTTVNWGSIAQRWKEFKAGTVGDGIFPDDYQLNYVDTKGKEKALPEELAWSENKISFTIASQSANMGFVVYRDGNEITPVNGAFTLENGENKLGFCFYGKVNNKWQYVDFQYVTITYSGLSIEPDSQQGETNAVMDYEAVCDSPPDDASYDWYLDGALWQSGMGTEIQVAFSDAGEHTILVQMMDKDGELVQEAEAVAVVVDPETNEPEVNRLAIIQQYKYFKAGISGAFNGEYIYPNSTESKSSYNGLEAPYGWESEYKYMEIEWNGTSFSGSHSNDMETYQISGEVSEDGYLIKFIDYVYTYQYSSSDGYKTDRDVRISFTNIPISEYLGSDFSFYAEGEQLHEVLKETYSHELRTKDGELKEDATITSPDWTGEGWQNTPHGGVYFYKNKP